MANTSNLTGTEIITQALAQVGNSAIVLEAQVALNSILDRFYTDYRWPFLRETATGSLSASAYDTALPSNFVDVWNKNSFRITDPDASGSDRPIEIMTQSEYEQLTYQALPGTPTKVVFDYEALTFTLYPRPNKTLSYSLTYRKRFVPITDFDVVINFPNDDLLIQAVFVWALKWEDDDGGAARITKYDPNVPASIQCFTE
jgi:hypothetical protein